MEVIGCAASVSQLLVYVTASAFRLHRLCSELRHGNSIYRNEETNISLLLNILHRLPGQDKQADDSIFPILLDITDVARQTLLLLEPKTICGINWTPLLSHGKIQLAFQSLEEKRRLLHLYISQAHNDALINLRETIHQSSMSSSLGTDRLTPPTSDRATSSSTAAGPTAATSASGSTPPNPPPDPIAAQAAQPSQYSGSTFIVSACIRLTTTRVLLTLAQYSARGSRTHGVVSHMNRETLPNANIDFNDHVVGQNAASFMGNQNEPSEQTISELNARQQATRAPEPGAASQGRVLGTDVQTDTQEPRIANSSSAEFAAHWRGEKNR